MPLIVERESLVITSIARRLQHGATISQVSKNWRSKGRLTELKRLLMGTPVLQFTHVKRNGNRVADALANEGVGIDFPFHVEMISDKNECMI